MQKGDRNWPTDLWKLQFWVTINCYPNEINTRDKKFMKICTYPSEACFYFSLTIPKFCKNPGHSLLLFVGNGLAAGHSPQASPHFLKLLLFLIIIVSYTTNKIWFCDDITESKPDSFRTRTLPLLWTADYFPHPVTFPRGRTSQISPKWGHVL